MDVAGLPLDFRTLVQLFETDDRPSLLVRTHERTFPHSRSVDRTHGNQAWKAAGYDDHSWAKVLDEFWTRTDDVDLDGEKAVSIVNVEEDGEWRLRSLGSKWWALVHREPKAAEYQIQGSRDDGNPPHIRTTDLRKDEITLERSSDSGSIDDVRDWTRFPVPGLSPWKEFVLNHDWASTVIGSMELWPLILRQNVVSIMENPMPRLIIWGPQKAFLYNEATIPSLGSKHPFAFGRPGNESWAEIWSDINPLIDAAYSGKTMTLWRQPLAMDRHGYLEDTYWDYTLLPIRGPDGVVLGVLDEFTDRTPFVRSERRRLSEVRISEQISSADTLKRLWPAFLAGLEDAVEDFPFAMIYAVVEDEPDDLTRTSSSGFSTLRKKCVLEGTIGLLSEGLSAYSTFSLLENLEVGPGIVSSCVEAWKSEKTVTLSCDDGSLPPSLAASNSGGSVGDVPKFARVAPIITAIEHEVIGIMVIGLSSRCPHDSEFDVYCNVITDLLTKTASLISVPEERCRAQMMMDDMNRALARQLHMTKLQAEKSEAKFSRMAASAPTGMFVYDPDGRMLYVNETYLGILGETREEHARRSAISIALSYQIHEDDLDRFTRNWSRLVKDKTPISTEYRLRRPWKSVDKGSGQELTGETWLQANAFPELEPDGTVSSIHGWLTDISHSKFSSNLLNQRLEDALEHKRQTENFIDMTSHEMRNPLSAILQSADSIVNTLRATTLPATDSLIHLTKDAAEDLVDSAQTIILCAQHQKRIVDDILTLSKLDANLLVISPDKVQPPTLITMALKMYEAEISRAGITATICIEPSYEKLAVDWAILDSSRLLQVVINLLTNSIKFTQHSDTRQISICLGASHERPTGKHHEVSFIPCKDSRPVPESHHAEWGNGENIYLQIAVSDTGRGMSDYEMQALFQRFSQASPKTYKQYGGSGLGLFVGSSEFQIQRLQRPPNIALTCDQISRELCELQGGQIGVRSGHGSTAFAFFIRAERCVSDNTSGRPTNPALPGSTSANVGANLSGQERGEPANLCASPDSLQSSRIRRQTRNEGVQESSPTANPSSSNSSDDTNNEALLGKTPLHVLIVEDNLINQKVMSQQLRRAGCVVHVANHGLECLKFLDTTSFCATSESATPLSMILLDLEMPTMDGLTTIKHIREQQLEGKIEGYVPVIAVTANARSEQIATAMEAGMDHVVTKPFRIPELIPQMEMVMARVAQETSDTSSS